MHSLGANSPSSTSSDISMSADQEPKCKAIDKITGEPCGETKGLRILDEFRRLYEARMEKIDQESNEDSIRISMKMQIMSDWIKDLGEQNTMLVHTVEDLEQTACSRVKLLEEKLKQSQIIADNATGSNYSEETLNILSNRVDELQKDEKYLQEKIEYLQSDIRGLLELIRRACWQNLWSLEGLTFFEIQRKDIPVPLDCICDQVNTCEIANKEIKFILNEQMDTNQIKSLSLQIEKLEENEKKMIRYQSGLEEKIASLTTDLSMKNDTIEKYVSRLQCFCDKLKEYSKQANCVIKHSSTTTSDKDYDIMLIPDILESILIAKNAESNSLRLQLQDLESELMIHSHEKNIDTNNLQIQLEEKCQKIEQLEDKLNFLEKEAIVTRDALTSEITEKLNMVMSLRTEITTLEEQNHHANIGNLLKEDLIKEMCKELKHVTLKDTWKAHADKSNFSKGELLLFLNNAKLHIQKECEILSDLKLELRKFIEKITINDNGVHGCITKNDLYTSCMPDKLVNCIEIITKMYTEREKEINLFDCMIRKEENVCTSDDSKNIKLNVNDMKQFKLMEEFRICTVEVQAVTEDVREEINNVVLSFNSRHQNYEELNEMIVNKQDGLAKTRERLLETINRLELQGEDKSRYNERIVNSGLKLKDIKNEINRIQSELSCINGMAGHIIQEHDNSVCTRTSTSNYLLSEAIEEFEQMLSNLQTFQSQDNYITSTLMVLKNHLCSVECSLKDLQKKNSEVLICDKLAQTKFNEKENRLIKFEKEVDSVHSKMEDVLEILVHMKEEKEQIPHHTFDNQATNDILKANKELRKLTKEYDDLKFEMIQQTNKIKYDEELNEWKNRVTDLEDQIRTLQHETKCKQEANNFLKNSIQLVEEELNMLQIKAKDDRQYHNKDNIEFKKKILELENIIKTQKNTAFSRSDYSFKLEDMSQFKIIQNAIQSAKLAIQYFEDQFIKECMCEESSRPSASSVLLKDELGKCKEYLDICCHELDEFSNAICTKEKLLKNMEEIIRIQKDSLTMSQAEVKDLHQKLQDKIDKQSLVITQYEREKNELLKENEFQIQTIGHLQNAVVEAKRNLDQMGHKTMSDFYHKDETIRQLTMCIDETQDQYNECFTEVTNQDLLLDLQRDAIDSLHKKIQCLEYDKYLIATILHTVYYSILSVMQEQIHNHIQDFSELKRKMEHCVQAKNLERKCTDTKEICNNTDQLRKLHTTCPCTEYHEVKNRTIEESQYLVNNCARLEEHLDNEAEIENMEHIKRLKALLEKIKDIEYSLRCENQQLKSNLQYHILETENLKKKLEQKEIECKKLISKLANGEREIQDLNDRVINNEEITKNEFDNAEILQNKLFSKNRRIEKKPFEFDTLDEIYILCDRVYFLEVLLREKSNDMVKIQADCQFLKNENLILKRQNDIIETQSKEDISQLKRKFKNSHLKLYQIEGFQQLIEDSYKIQKQLILAPKRKTNLQVSLITMEKDYCSKIVNVESEMFNIRNLADKLSKELEDTNKKLSAKDIEFSQMQDKHKRYADQLDTIHQDFEKQKENLMEAENINRTLIQQMQKYENDNHSFEKQRIALEENSFLCVTELQDMHKSLIELKKECQLKDKSLTAMLVDLTEAAIDRSEVCEKYQYIVSCIRDYMVQQKKYSEALVKTLENKQQYLRQLILEKRALLIKIRKLTRLNLLAQKLKKMRKPLAARNSKKKYFIGTIRTSKHTSTHGNSWWFPRMEYLINKIRKSNQWWNKNIANGRESDTSLETTRDYGYQSSTSK